MAAIFMGVPSTYFSRNKKSDFNWALNDLARSEGVYQLERSYRKIASEGYPIFF
jgi:hypothetical protein